MSPGARYNYRGYNRDSQLEKTTQRQIMDWLREAGYLYWRVVPYNGRGLSKDIPRGMPDVMTVRRGKFVCFEVKRKGAQLRPEQQDFELRVFKAGGLYCRVETLAEAVAVMELG
jgi:hypothetical protein